MLSLGSHIRSLSYSHKDCSGGLVIVRSTLRGTGEMDDGVLRYFKFLLFLMFLYFVMPIIQKQQSVWWFVDSLQITGTATGIHFPVQIGSYHNTHGNAKIYPDLRLALRSMLLRFAKPRHRQSVVFHLFWAYAEKVNVTKIIGWKFTAFSRRHYCFKTKNTEQVLK
jgi:hypothetical protein